jgi:hypothetical protein
MLIQINHDEICDFWKKLKAVSVEIVKDNDFTAYSTTLQEYKNTICTLKKAGVVTRLGTVKGCPMYATMH